MTRVGDLSDPAVAALYARVPAGQMQRFHSFREEFPPKELQLDGLAWPYLCGGKGEPPLLLLSGALTVPDLSWRSIAGFAERRQVIAPAYPPVSDMDALADGIAAILRYEDIQQAHVMGGSYGGFVAQVFVRRYPEMVLSLVLSHTQPPDAETGKRMRGVLRWLRLLPTGLIRTVMRQTFQPMLPPESVENALLYAIFNELVEYRLDKKDVIGILERTRDYAAKRFGPSDLADWPGKVLLLFGENDSATPPVVREQLKSLYPNSQAHVFAGSGHATAVTEEEAYRQVVERFWEDEENA